MAIGSYLVVKPGCDFHNVYAKKNDSLCYWCTTSFRKGRSIYGGYASSSYKVVTIHSGQHYDPNMSIFFSDSLEYLIQMSILVLALVMLQDLTSFAWN